jgi:hypothetical protein
MALTVGELRELIAFVSDDTPVIFQDAEYGYCYGETAELRFIIDHGVIVEMAPEDAPITTDIGLVIW